MSMKNIKKLSNKNLILLLGICLVGFLVRIYRLNELMIFFGDIGWFYLSARDILLTGHIPLVGITTSQVWLHQGPLWTYLLAGALFLGNYNPLSGAYMTVLFGTVSISGIYFVATKMFGEKVAWIGALLYATSPLIVVYDRMPYHTALISPLMLVFLYTLYRWVKGNPQYFVGVVLSLALLYNFELASVVLWFLVVALLVYGWWKKKTWVTGLKDTKIFVSALVAFIIPMFPVLAYDTQHQYLQTIKFAHWVIYLRIIKPLFELKLFTNSSGTSFDTLQFYAQHYIKTIFLQNELFALGIFVISSIWIGITIRKYYKKLLITPHGILLLCFATLLGGFLTNITLSEAYIPFFFPVIILVTALTFEWLLSLQNAIKFPAAVNLMLFCLVNIYALNAQNYLVGVSHGYGVSYKARIEAVDTMLRDSQGSSFSLVGRGPGSQFESFTQNYEYLIWWKGKTVDKKSPKTRFEIAESSTQITLKQYKIANKKN